MSNLSLPQELMEALQCLRPVFHACSWESFLYLITGLLLGQAQPGIVRASLCAPQGYNWRRMHDLLRRNRWRARIGIFERISRKLPQSARVD